MCDALLWLLLQFVVADLLLLLRSSPLIIRCFCFCADGYCCPDRCSGIVHAGLVVLVSAAARCCRYGVTYEKLDAKKMMRVPFVSKPPPLDAGAQLQTDEAEIARCDASHTVSKIVSPLPNILSENPRAHKNKIGNSPPKKNQITPPLRGASLWA